MSAGHSHMNEVLRRRGRPQQPAEIAADVPEHDHPHVAPLIRARAEAEFLGDQEFVDELNGKLRRIDPTLAPRIEGVDGGAGRGQGGARDLNPDKLLWAEIRGALIEKRERRRWLGGAYD